MENKKRYGYIDNIKWIVIILVVMVHVNVTYGNLGSWYYVEKAELGIVTKVLSGLFGAFSQSFFMGIMFLYAGYFTPRSFDKKGFYGYTTDKLKRLGLPVLFYMFAIHPLNIFIIEKFINSNKVTMEIFITKYKEYVTGLGFIGSTGPLWFALALLIFSIIYGIIRKIVPLKGFNIEVPSGRKILLFMAAVSVMVFGIRIIQPIGTSILNMQICFFVMYTALFVLGIIAYRNNWFEKWEYKSGKKWLNNAFILGIPLFFIMMVSGGALKDTAPLMGGPNWQAFTYALWETFIGTAMCIGLTVVFREKFDKMNKITEILRANTFGIYVFHAPVLIGVSAVLKNIAVMPEAKFAAAAVSTIILSLLISMAIRKIPGFGRIFD